MSIEHDLGVEDFLAEESVELTEKPKQVEKVSLRDRLQSFAISVKERLGNTSAKTSDTVSDWIHGRYDVENAVALSSSETAADLKRQIHDLQEFLGDDDTSNEQAVDTQEKIDALSERLIVAEKNSRGEKIKKVAIETGKLAVNTALFTTGTKLAIDLPRYLLQRQAIGKEKIALQDQYAGEITENNEGDEAQVGDQIEKRMGDMTARVNESRYMSPKQKEILVKRIEDINEERKNRWMSRSYE